MSDIKDWSNDESGNTAAPPDGAPENGTLISDLNGIDRETMAAVRRFYESPDYRDLGHTLLTSTSTNSALLEGDVQAAYSVGQSVEYDDQGGTGKHAYISAINLQSTNTELTLSVNGDSEDTVDPDITRLSAGPNLTEMEQPPPVVVGTPRAAVRVDADGGTKNLPSSMGMIRLNKGRYRLSHNLDTNGYIVMLTLRSSNPLFIAVSERDQNTATIEVWDTAGADDDQPFELLLIEY